MARAGRVALLFAVGACACRASAGAWEPAPPLNTARSEMHAAVLGGCVYVVGGIAANLTTASAECFDLAAGTWRRLPPLPEVVNHAPMAALDGAMWVSGGFADLFRTLAAPVLWRYDPARRAWSGGVAMPGRRAAHALLALDDRLYVVGGVGDAPAEVWSYAPATRRWNVRHAPLPTLLEHTSGVAYGGKLWIFGGRWAGAGESRVVLVYDPAKDAWHRGPDMPEARGGHTAAVLGRVAYVLGGQRPGSGDVEDRMLRFDFETQRWQIASRAESPSLPRHGLGSAVAGGCLWLAGGGLRAGWRTLFAPTSRVEKLCR